MSLKPKRVNFDDIWQKLLETAQLVILGQRVERILWNDRFSDIYELCVAHPEPLSDKLYNATKTFLESHVNEKLAVLRDVGDENLLSTYYNFWREFSQGASYLNLLYGYLNSQYIKKQKISEADMNYGGFTIDTNEQLMEIGELALETWKRTAVEPIRSSLVRLLLEQIDQDRVNGRTMNHVTVQGAILSFVEMEKFKAKNPLKYYEEVFEEQLLQQTSKFYAQEAMKCVDRYDCHEYMIKVHHFMHDENIRCKKFLSGSSFEKVVREYQMRLVQDHLQFLHKECRTMVQKELREDLGNMYRLLNPLHNGLCVLIQEVESHIKQTCLEAVQGLQGENISQQFVESLLAIHGKYSELVQSVFNNDQQFIAALDKACTAAINFRQNPKGVCRAPELLAKYIDSLLKRSLKGMTETEADDKLTTSITIFKYLDDKDVFNRFYAKLLTKRLIYGLSQSMDAEESLINRLKQACGYEFTSKLHKMFSDMNINVDLNNKFATFLKEDETPVDLGVSFTILVLQAGAWPINQGNLPTFALPQELERSVHMFEQFYSKNYTGRKLTWIHAFCQCEVKMNYPKRSYFVTMGTFLVGILLQFNAAERLAFRELQEATLLPEKELTRHTQLLVDGKILLANEETITENSVFSLNLGYNNKRTKFKIMSTQKDTVQETEQTLTSVDEDRKLYLQATIVRIMKARKVLKHNLLIQEVLSQSQGRFAPSISHIKKCIETLIDKQYIERTKNSTDEYSYIA